jgi:hypothetical protein
MMRSRPALVCRAKAVSSWPLRSRFEARAGDQLALSGGRFGDVYTDKPGQPPLPTRLMAGLVIIKHMHNLSDEALCERWGERVLSILLRRRVLPVPAGV